MSATDGQWKKVFVFGGVRSGKSRFAAERAGALAGGKPILFIATADREAMDQSMLTRIERHVADRPDGWDTLEEPIDLATAMALPGEQQVALIDCLTLWLSNLFGTAGDPEAPEFVGNVELVVNAALECLIEGLDSARRHVIAVANDVGSGVAPPTKIGNVFADLQGMVNQRVAAASDEVYHMVAGIPTRIK